MTDDKFETWWETEGQFSRSGGGQYEKTFAFNAWQAATAQAVPTEPVGRIRTWHKNGERHADLIDWEDGINALADGEHKLYSVNHAQAVPDGWVLVPVEPTAKQLDAAVAFALNVSLSSNYKWSAYMRDLWTTFIRSYE